METNFSPEIEKMITFDFLWTLREETIVRFKQSDEANGRKSGAYEESTYWSWWAYLDGTYGFVEAVRASLEKHSMFELLAMYENMGWQESDNFDDSLCILLMKRGIIPVGEPEGYLYNEIK